MTTRALTKDEYETIIKTIRTGFMDAEGVKFRPSSALATLLVFQANTGLRLSDIVTYTDRHGVTSEGITLDSFTKNGDRIQFRQDFVEQKTKKHRNFIIPTAVYQMLRDYCYNNGIKPDEVIFKNTERGVQKALKKVCDYLGYADVSTHSFRKFFALDIYERSGKDIVLVQELLQHSDYKTTMRYIAVSDAKKEEALLNHCNIV